MSGYLDKAEIHIHSWPIESGSEIQARILGFSEKSARFILSMKPCKNDSPKKLCFSSASDLLRRRRLDSFPSLLPIVEPSAPTTEEESSGLSKEEEDELEMLR